MRNLLLALAISSSATAFADCTSETRPLKPAETAWFEKQVEEMKKALPAAPKGWAVDGEVSGYLPEEICGSDELEKGLIAPSTSVEIKYAQVEGAEELSARAQAILARVGSGKQTEKQNAADMKELQTISRSVRASIRISVNRQILQSSCGDVREVAVPGAVKAWRECTPETNGGDASAYTRAFFGRAKPSADVSGTIAYAWDKEPKAPYLSVTDYLVEIQAEPAQADAFMKQIAPVLAKSAPKK